MVVTSSRCIATRAATRSSRITVWASGGSPREAGRAVGVGHEHGRMVGVHREDLGHREPGVGERGVDLGLAPQRVRLVGAGDGGVGAEEVAGGRAVGRGQRHVPGLVAAAARAAPQLDPRGSGRARDPPLEVVDRGW